MMISRLTCNNTVNLDQLRGEINAVDQYAEVYLLSDGIVQVIHADDLEAIGEEALTEMGTDETGAAGDQDSFLACHVFWRASARIGRDRVTRARGLIPLRV